MPDDSNQPVTLTSDGHMPAAGIKNARETHSAAAPTLHVCAADQPSGPGERTEPNSPNYFDTIDAHG